MKVITSILSILAIGTMFATAAEEKKPAAASPEAAAGAKPAEGAKPKADPEKMFKKLDANSDGKVTSEEFMASPAAKKDAAKAEASFGKKDKNGDKSLDLAEFSAAGGKKKNK